MAEIKNTTSATREYATDELGMMADAKEYAKRDFDVCRLVVAKVNGVELSKEDSEFLRFFEENLMWDKIYNSEEFKKFINSHDRPFIDSKLRQVADWRSELLKRNGIRESYYELSTKYNKIRSGEATFNRDGKPIYNSGNNGKVILHSPSTGRSVFLFKHTPNEVKKLSQNFLKDNPDAEFISMDTGRYNFILENEKGLTKDDFIRYQAADLNRGDKVGYNIVYDNQMREYDNGEKKKMYYSDSELSKLDINKKNFDTLALQRELSNRGYKLPKSIKRDGTFDGVFGEEVKQTLLKYQQNKSNTK